MEDDTIMKNMAIFSLKTFIGIGFVTSGEFWLSQSNSPWQYIVVYLVGYTLMDIWAGLKYNKDKHYSG